MRIAIFFLTFIISAAPLLATAAGTRSSVSPELVETFVILDKKDLLSAIPEIGPPSLATQDPGTPGRYGFEISSGGVCEYSAYGRVCEADVDVVIGVGDRAQLSVARGRIHERENGSVFSGLGATDVGVKFRFYEKDGLQLAVAPSYRFDDASRKRAEDGTFEPTEGRSVYLPLIVSRDVQRGSSVYTVVASVGYRKNLDSTDTDSYSTAIAVEKDLKRNSRGMVEYANECNSAERACSQEVRVGWLKVIYPKSASRYQTSIYTKVGLGKDSEGHTRKSIQVGVHIQKKPRQ